MYSELAADNLGEILKSNKTTIVQYSASWCGNCRVMKPKFKKFAAENEELAFVMADAEQFPESRQLANVTNLPTFAVFEGDRFVTQIQTNKAESLKALIDEVTNH